MVRIGDVEISYTMQPLNADGSYVHGGNHYANAATIEAAREYAHNMVGATINYCCGKRVHAVAISGRTLRFNGGGWREVPGAVSSYEVVGPDSPTGNPADETFAELIEHLCALNVHVEMIRVHPSESHLRSEMIVAEYAEVAQRYHALRSPGGQLPTGRTVAGMERALTTTERGMREADDMYRQLWGTPVPERD